MKIRYLLDGFSVVSEDVEVVAKGYDNYYILVQGLSGVTLKAIPSCFIVAKIYQNAYDDAPFVAKFLEMAPDISDVDFSLSDISDVSH